MDEKEFEVYAGLVWNKTIRIITLNDLLLSRAPNFVIKEQIELLNKAETALNKYKKNDEIESEIARECIMTKMERQKIELIKKKSCLSCLVYQEWISPVAERGDVPDVKDSPKCSQERLEKIAKENYIDCKEYKPNEYLREEFSESDGKTIQRLNNLLGLLDQGLMRDYKKLLLE